jgi:hypothetical protein
VTFATQDILTVKDGPEDQALPTLIQVGVASATTIYGGTMVQVNASGYAVPAGTGLGSVVGRCERQVINTTAAGFGTNGALQVLIDRGAFWYNLNADSTVTIANFGANVYASDDNTVSLSDAGGTRPLAGYLLCVPTTPGIPGTINGTGSTKVLVQIGQPNPWAGSVLSPSSAGTARAVVTALSGTYTGSTTGVLTSSAASAFGTQDGVAVVAGDVVFLPAGTTHITAASDAGPYTITTIGTGSVNWVLTRPDWWATGATLPYSTVVKIGGEGTLFQGSTWKSFAAKGSAVVDTNDPKTYPDTIIQQVTQTAGAVTITNVPILSATKSIVIPTMSAVGGTMTGITGFQPLVITPGAIGTASVTVTATGTAMATEATGSAVLNVAITNW